MSRLPRELWDSVGVWPERLDDGTVVPMHGRGMAHAAAIVAGHIPLDRAQANTRATRQMVEALQHGGRFTAADVIGGLV